MKIYLLENIKKSQKQKALMVMKMLSFFLIIFALPLSANSYSQSKKISLALENVTLRKVFSEIEDQSEFDFFYNNSVVDESVIVSVNANNRTISSILKRLLQSLDLNFTVYDKDILITGLEQDAEGTLPDVNILTQARDTVRGTVVDESGMTIPGASVYVKNNNAIGTITDADGKFLLALPNLNEVLIVSFVGYETQEIALNGRKTLDVIMKSSLINMEEVVVTAMGISREAKSLGYAITNLNSEEITESSTTNFANALAGKVPGVQISSSSGDVGSSTRITIRGVTSLSGQNSPLIVVDGIPIDNSSRSNRSVDWGSGLNDINMQDVEELSVLKGASASALYGSRAAKGAIIIKTKSGQASKGLGVRVSSRATFYRPFILPDFQNTYGAGYDVDTYNYWTGNTGGGYGPKLDDGQFYVQMNSPMVRDENGNILYDEDGIPVFQPLEWKARKDMNDFFETGVDLINTVEVSNGSDKYNARLSVSNTQTDGMVYNTDYHKNDISFSGNYKVTDNFSFNANVQYHMGGSDNRTYGDNLPENAIKSALFMPANYDFNFLRDYANHEAMGIPLTDFVYPGTNEGIRALNWDRSDYYPNPFFLLDNKMLAYNFSKLLAIVGFDFDITSWLTLSGKMAKESNSQVYEDKANDGIRHWTGSVYSYKGFYNYSSVNMDNTTMNFILRASKTIDEFSINSFIGGEQYYYVYKSNGYNIPELTISGFFHPDNAAGEITVSKYTSEKKVNSLFGSVELGYHNGLFLEMTGRNDWSSTLPAENRSYFYPSVKLAALLHEFIALPGWLSFLKVRASLAQVGADTSPYNLAPVFSSRNQITGIYEATVQNSLSNPTLKPERTRSWETGLDLRLFQGRLSLDVAYYNSKSFDQIMRIEVSETTGYNSRYINVGEIDNHGVELSLTTIPVKTANFNWELTFNYSKNKNTVVELAEGVERLQIGSGIYTAKSYAVPGEPYGVIYGHGFQRNENGDIITVDGYAPYTDDVIPLGNILPDWIGGLNSTFRYKNFTAGVLVDVKMGGSMQSATVNWLRRDGLVSETNVADLRENGVVIDGVMNIGTEEEPEWVENNVAIPFSSFLSTTNEYYNDESMIFDASYIKLKEMSLYYTVPSDLTRKIWIQNLRIGVVGRNLALFYANVPHIDPETSLNSLDSGQGWETFNTPSRRSLNVSLIFDF